MKEIESEEEFKKAISEHKVVAIDFFTSWCTPCKMFSPKLDEILHELKKKDGVDVEIQKVDCDKVVPAADSCGVRSVPTLVFYVNGKPDKKVIVGNEDKDVVVARFSEILNDVDGYAGKMEVLQIEPKKSKKNK